MGDRKSEEFYCNECQGYFIVRLNLALDHEVEIVCPQCKHKHRRCIKDGHIFEVGRFNTESKEEIMPTIATYSKEPHSKAMQDAHKSHGSRRDRVPYRPPMYDRWLDVAARERGED